MAASDPRRVKIYCFNDNMQWEDMGTGHVFLNYVERLQSLIIRVRSEDDGKLLPHVRMSCTTQSKRSIGLYSSESEMYSCT